MTDTPAIEPTRRVRGSIAFLLGLVSGWIGGWGLAFFYARRTSTALWLTAIEVVLLIPASLILSLACTVGFAGWRLNLPFTTASLLPALLGLLAVVALFAIWAAISAWRRPVVPRAPPTRLLGYFAVAFVPMAVSFAAQTWLETVAKTFSTPSAAMSPTLVPDDRFVVVPLQRLGGASALRSGDLVVYRHDDGRIWVKRLLALPGQSIEFRHGVPWLDGAPVAQTSLGQFTSDGAAVERRRESLGTHHYVVEYQVDLRAPQILRDRGRIVVPPGEMFVVGDARDNSMDSRYEGPVSLQRVVGRAVRIYLSADQSRIGRTLD